MKNILNKMANAIQQIVSHYSEDWDYCPICGGPASLDDHAEDCPIEILSQYRLGKWKNDLMVKIMEIVYVLDNQNKIELLENWKESAKQRYMSDVAFKYRVNMAFAYLTGENSEN